MAKSALPRGSPAPSSPAAVAQRCAPPPTCSPPSSSLSPPECVGVRRAMPPGSSRPCASPPTTSCAPSPPPCRRPSPRSPLPAASSSSPSIPSRTAWSRTSSATSSAAAACTSSPRSRFSRATPRPPPTPAPPAPNCAPQRASRRDISRPSAACDDCAGGAHRMDYQEIRYHLADGILTITLHRPDRLNAFTERMGGELIDAFDRADADDALRAIVGTGAGRAFCAGADLSIGGGTFDYAARPQGIDEHRDGGGLVALRIFELKKPIIAAINGPAVGVGVTMTLPMDVRLAASNARFGFVFARRGIVPEACSSWFLPRVVGISQALEWTFSGRVFAAEEALAGRLLSRVLEPDALLPAAYALAREIADNTSAVSVALT